MTAMQRVLSMRQSDVQAEEAGVKSVHRYAHVGTRVITTA
jgi:hypothetical protein